MNLSSSVALNISSSLFFSFFVAIPSASKKVSPLDKCPNSCHFACDGQSEGCICPRGYEMNRGTCHGVYPMSKYLLILVAKDCDNNLEDLYSFLLLFYYYDCDYYKLKERLSSVQAREDNWSPLEASMSRFSSFSSFLPFSLILL